MPDYVAGVANANIRNERSVSYALKYPGGYSTTVQLGNGLLGDFDYSLGEISALRESIADATNFGIQSQAETLVNGVAIQNVQAYDESYGPGTVLNLSFENNDGEVFALAIPGPRAFLFTPSGALIAPDAAADAGTPAKRLADLITDVENLVNRSYTPSNSYAFVRGAIATRKMKPARNAASITSIEPPGTDDGSSQA